MSATLSANIIDISFIVVNFLVPLLQYIEPVIGLAKDIDTGKVLFEHRGIHHYTIGKRIRTVPDSCQSSVGLFAAAVDDKTQTLWVVRVSLFFLVQKVKFLMTKI